MIAIRFKCCDTWYPCIACHHSLAGHEAEVWPFGARDERAILCGVCGYRLTIKGYLGSGSVCPGCGAHFNPGCAAHYHHYFESSGDRRDSCSPLSSPSR